MADTAKPQPQASKDEQIGFHKGALSTLMKEREEMAKVLQIVEQLMQMHVKALKDLGVDLVAQAQAQQGQNRARGAWHGWILSRGGEGRWESAANRRGNRSGSDA